MSQNWNLKKAKKHFKGSDLHEQVIEAFTKAGYEVEKEWITNYGNICGPYGNAIALQKEQMRGRIKLDGSLMDFRYGHKSFKVDMNEKKFVIFFTDDILAPYIRFKKDETTSPTITAHFLPDGALDKMEISLSFPGEIEKELHFECELVAYNPYIKSPYIKLEVKEYNETNLPGNYLTSISELYLASKPCGELKCYVSTKAEDKYSSWKGEYIADAAFLLKLREWKDKLLLAYQTSDAKALVAVLTCLEEMLHSKNRQDDFKERFSELIVKCLECLGKYTDEVLESTSADLGLSDSGVMRYILEYVKKQ